MKSSIAAGACAVALVSCWAGTAAAAEDDFATRGRFAVSAERLFGITWTKQSTDQNGVSGDADTLSFSILANRSAASLYSVPRIGFDYFVIQGLSLGTAIGYSTASLHEKVTGGATSVDQDVLTLKGFIVAPRIGYAYMFNNVVGIWPRAGITYGSVSDDVPGTGNTSVSEHGLAVTLEVPLVISPVPHVAFTIAPTFDIGVSGSAKVDAGTALGMPVAGSVDVNSTDLGLQAGLLVWF